MFDKYFSSNPRSSPLDTINPLSSLAILNETEPLLSGSELASRPQSSAFLYDLPLPEHLGWTPQPEPIGRTSRLDTRTCAPGRPSSAQDVSPPRPTGQHPSSNSERAENKVRSLSRLSTTTKSSACRSPKSIPGSFVCLWDPTCQRSFLNSYDRRRHMETHSRESRPRYDCPEAEFVPWCDRKGERGFTRKDHRDQHRRKVHMVDLPRKARGIGRQEKKIL